MRFNWCLIICTAGNFQGIWLHVGRNSSEKVWKECDWRNLGRSHLPATRHALARLFHSFGIDSRWGWTFLKRTQILFWPWADPTLPPGAWSSAHWPSACWLTPWPAHFSESLHACMHLCVFASSGGRHARALSLYRASEPATTWVLFTALSRTPQSSCAHALHLQWSRFTISQKLLVPGCCANSWG